MERPINPLLVAFLAFNPAAPSPLIGGSWGVVSITPVVPGQSFSVILSPQFAGGLSAAQASLLHITATVHEIYSGQTITPIANGFVIDFGSVMTNPITIKVEKLISE